MFNWFKSKNDKPATPPHVHEWVDEGDVISCAGCVSAYPVSRATSTPDWDTRIRVFEARNSRHKVQLRGMRGEGLMNMAGIGFTEKADAVAFAHRIKNSKMFIDIEYGNEDAAVAAATTPISNAD